MTPTVKYVVVWRRQKDGTWKLHRDIWNAIPQTPKQQMDCGGYATVALAKTKVATRAEAPRSLGCPRPRPAPPPAHRRR